MDHDGHACRGGSRCIGRGMGIIFLTTAVSFGGGAGRVEVMEVVDRVNGVGEVSVRILGTLLDVTLGILTTNIASQLIQVKSGHPAIFGAMVGSPTPGHCHHRRKPNRRLIQFSTTNVEDFLLGIVSAP